MSQFNYDQASKPEQIAYDAGFARGETENCAENDPRIKQLLIDLSRWLDHGEWHHGLAPQHLLRHLVNDLYLGGSIDV